MFYINYIRYAKNSYPFIGGIIMFINYKKHYENFVNEIEWLWNGFFMGESEDTNEIYEGYFDTLPHFLQKK